jgi:hypothetical protein
MILKQNLENARSQENNNADNYLKINSISKKYCSYVLGIF